MAKTAIKIENLSKLYRLGEVGTGTLSHDLNRWWARARGKEDPFAKVGQVNDRTQKSEGSDYVWALKDIDFEVKQGEVLGIIGKNGAGKSTLLKLLSKITAPTTGSIKARGRVASLLEVGTGMHPEMTGIENVYLNGTILGMTKAEIKGKLDDILDFAGCAKYGDTPVKRYSSGMKVRLGFAVAAFLEPEILIVDEVLAVGDAEFQKRAIGKMQDISREGGRTVLFVSHNMASVKTLCNRGVVLGNGMMEFKGSAEEAVNQYLLGNKEDQLSSNEVFARKQEEASIGFVFTSMVITNEDGVAIDQVISGEAVNIVLGYRINSKLDPSKIIFSVIFFDQNDNKALLITSDEVGFRLSGDGSNRVEIQIPAFYMRANRYRIKLFSSYRTTEPEDFLDVIERAGSINVVPGDLWRTGKANRSGGFGIFPLKIVQEDAARYVRSN